MSLTKKILTTSTIILTGVSLAACGKNQTPKKVKIKL